MRRPIPRSCNSSVIVRTSLTDPAEAIELPGRPFTLGLFGSVAMVLALLRQNIVQQVAAEMFRVSQATVSRRWDALREVIEAVLAEFVLTPAEIAGNSTVLVNGTLVPTWEWRHRTDLYSGKHADTRFNGAVALIERG